MKIKLLRVEKNGFGAVLKLGGCGFGGGFMRWPWVSRLPLPFWDRLWMAKRWHERNYQQVQLRFMWLVLVYMFDY